MSNTSISNSANGIIDIIAAVDRGEALLDFEQANIDVVDAVRSTGKGGKVVLELSYIHDAQADAMRVSVNVKKTMPQKKSKASLFFVTPEGRLSRMDSRQPSMFIEKGTINV